VSKNNVGRCSLLTPTHPPVDGKKEESQNHRMFRVGRDLCGPFSPTLLPKQGHLQQAAQDLAQEKGERLTN